MRKQNAKNDCLLGKQNVINDCLLEKQKVKNKGLLEKRRERNKCWEKLWKNTRSRRLITYEKQKAEKATLSVPETPLREATLDNIYIEQKSKDEMVMKDSNTKKY